MSGCVKVKYLFISVQTLLKGPAPPAYKTPLSMCIFNPEVLPYMLGTWQENNQYPFNFTSWKINVRPYQIRHPTRLEPLTNPSAGGCLDHKITKTIICVCSPSDCFNSFIVQHSLHKAPSQSSFTKLTLSVNALVNKTQTSLFY